MCVCVCVCPFNACGTLHIYTLDLMFYASTAVHKRVAEGDGVNIRVGPAILLKLLVNCKLQSV